MADRKVSPSSPVDSSGQASKLPWTTADRLVDPDGRALALQSELPTSVSLRDDPDWLIPGTKTQPLDSSPTPVGFEVAVPSTGKYLIIYSGWFDTEEDGDGDAEVDLYNGTDAAVFPKTGRKCPILTTILSGSLSTQTIADLTEDDVIYPRWAKSGATIHLRDHELNLVRIGNAS